MVINGNLCRRQRSKVIRALWLGSEPAVILNSPGLAAAFSCFFSVGDKINKITVSEAMPHSWTNCSYSRIFHWLSLEQLLASNRDRDLDLTVWPASNEPTLSAEMVIRLSRLRSTVVRTRENVQFQSDKLFPMDLSSWICLHELIHDVPLFLSCYCAEKCDEAYAPLLE